MARTAEQVRLLRREARGRGNCGRCLTRSAEPEKSCCAGCASRVARSVQRVYQARRAAGKCGRCGEPSSTWECAGCAARTEDTLAKHLIGDVHLALCTYGPSTAQEVYEALRDLYFDEGLRRPELRIVRRALMRLLEQGEVKTEQRPGQATLYQLTGEMAASCDRMRAVGGRQ